jgi:integrase
VFKSFADRPGPQGSRLAKEEAERFLAEAMLRRSLGAPEPATRRVRFREFAAEWLRDYAQAHVGAATYVNYESVLRVHLVPELGRLYLSQITRKDLDALVADWASGGPRFQERVRLARDQERERAGREGRNPRPVRVGRSAKTISNAIVPLREMLGHAVEWGYLAINPAVGVKRPRDRRPAEQTMRVLDPDQLRRLMAAAEPGLDRTLLMTAAASGARMGELRALQWADLDHDRGRLWVRRSVGLDGVQQPKSRRSVRAVAIPPTLVQALLEQRMASRHKKPADFMFASDAGTPLDPANLRRRYKAALRRAGLPAVRFHDLRHSYASVLVQQGAHPKFISEQLGHASVQITMDRYSHLLDQSYADESAKLEAALFSGSAGSERANGALG